MDIIMGGGSFFLDDNSETIDAWEKRIGLFKEEHGSLPKQRSFNKVKSLPFDKEMREQFLYIISSLYPESDIVQEAIQFNKKEVHESYANKSLNKTLMLLLDYAESKDDVLKPSENLIRHTLTRSLNNNLDYHDRKKMHMVSIVQHLYQFTAHDITTGTDNINRDINIGNKIQKEDETTHLDKYFNLYSSYAKDFLSNDIDASNKLKIKEKANKKMIKGFNKIIRLAQ